jgi:holo-[acyl-carrier protein] synthase
MHEAFLSGSGSSALAGLPRWAIEAGYRLDESRDGSVQCGIDIIEIDRIRKAVERWGTRFVNRVWTPLEQRVCRGRYPELAARFAAKEAASKALGTGIVGIVWREIEVLPDARGKPLLFLHGAAMERAEILGFDTMAISISHTKIMACAMVVAIARSTG